MARLASPGPCSTQTPEPGESSPRVGATIPAPEASPVGPAPLPVWTRFLPAGRVVVREGDPGSSMFVILEGKVGVYREAGSREARLVTQLSGGGFFGELAMMAKCPRTASVVTLERTVLRELSHTGLSLTGSRYGLDAPVVAMRCRERLLADALCGSPVLSELSPELWAQLGSALVPCAVEAGAQLLTYGQPGEALYILLRGRCGVFHTHADGHTTAYPDMVEGDLFGEVSLLRGHRATATVKALTPCTLLRLDRDVFRKHFWGQAEMRRALVRLGLARMHRTMDVIANPGG
ncbi:cyclic nucleotide-binding domain-containing protein [Myxococcus sp. CA051A]|uniref:Cyclic nucleotide-binding domain-containing protein n=1 Tax=Myxococcus llanfairpwllgwyngyllgogerychwyrndrobwllllantysiliogogogochensis TaxID=2590453 RepID=A0A540WQH6_9BACT|nr:cyclic nucleotide-binding domain-containing protein [Myxococcus sp. CA051A]NTX62484.1 cyclic nucleotide-binding domain-containing protein [Myxococcus sp. CA051A]TQF11270.1 cyclic nucleotide-binding domain-containing protein [Myxococcus llanfairpwllgwyngyllgogerychwyrndrobwllllantysiliogogogochensis]